MKMIPRNLSGMSRHELLIIEQDALRILTDLKNSLMDDLNPKTGPEVRAVRRQIRRMQEKHQNILKELAHRKDKLKMHQRFFVLICEEIGESRAKRLMEQVKNDMP